MSRLFSIPSFRFAIVDPTSAIGKWSRIATFGPKSKDGASMVFDATTLGQMVDNAARRGDKIAICNDHASAYPESRDAPALGFFGALAVVAGGKVIKAWRGEPDASALEDGLYARLDEVTPRGADPLVGLANYRSLSPMFSEDGRDEKGEAVGFALFDVAATNVPFQSGAEIMFHGMTDGKVTMGVIREQHGELLINCPKCGQQVWASPKEFGDGRYTVGLHSTDGTYAGPSCSMGYKYVDKNGSVFPGQGLSHTMARDASGIELANGDRVRIESSDNAALNGREGTVAFIDANHITVSLVVNGSMRSADVAAKNVRKMSAHPRATDGAVTMAVRAVDLKRGDEIQIGSARYVVTDWLDGRARVSEYEGGKPTGWSGWADDAWLAARGARKLSHTFRIEHRGSKWVVLPETGDKVLGEHDTEEEAQAQLRAIEANKGMSFNPSGEGGLHNAETVKMAQEPRTGEKWKNKRDGSIVTVRYWEPGSQAHNIEYRTEDGREVYQWINAFLNDYQKLSAAPRGEGVTTMAKFQPGEKVKVQGDDRVVTVVEEIDDGKQVVIKTDQGQEHILPSKLIVKMSTPAARRFNSNGGSTMNPQLMAKLGLAEDASDADKLAALMKYAEDAEAKLMTEIEIKDDKEEKEIEAMASDLGVEKGPGMMSRIRAAMGARFVPAVKFAALSAEVEAMRAEKEAEIAKAADASAQALADSAIANGYPAEQRDAFVTFAKTDRSAAEALIASLPGRRVLGRMTAGGAPVSGARTSSNPTEIQMGNVTVPVRGIAFSQMVKDRAAKDKISHSEAFRLVAKERPDLASEALGR